MMGFGTAFILLHFDDRDNFSTGIATIHRVFWSGTLGEIFDTTGDAETSVMCAESGPFLAGMEQMNFECRDVHLESSRPGCPRNAVQNLLHRSVIYWM
jgi:hypothetical protein